jgi:hypothetical protein
MATFVLVHGSWAGGVVWRQLAPRLRKAGHEVYRRRALRKPSAGSALPGRGRGSSHGSADNSSRIIASFLLYWIA